VDAGYFLSQRRGLRGLGESSPAQLGQIPASLFTQHCAQKVHSKLQIIASTESAGKSTPQHSQLGLICSMNISFEIFRFGRPIVSTSYLLTLVAVDLRFLTVLDELLFKFVNRIQRIGVVSIAFSKWCKNVFGTWIAKRGE
jgi:hypothetical protein